MLKYEPLVRKERPDLDRIALDWMLLSMFDELSSQEKLNLIVLAQQKAKLALSTSVVDVDAIAASPPAAAAKVGVEKFDGGKGVGKKEVAAPKKELGVVEKEMNASKKEMDDAKKETGVVKKGFGSKVERLVESYFAKRGIGSAGNDGGSVGKEHDAGKRDVGPSNVGPSKVGGPGKEVAPASAAPVRHAVTAPARKSMVPNAAAAPIRVIKPGKKAEPVNEPAPLYIDLASDD